MKRKQVRMMTLINPQLCFLFHPNPNQLWCCALTGKQETVVVLVILTLTLFCQGLLLTPPDGKQNGPIKGEELMVPAWVDHEPIVISGDADFDLQGWPGAGTEEDPYRIANLSITSSDTCIAIEQTSSYFIIKNCTLTTHGEGRAIQLSNLANGRIEGCNITWATGGIDLYSCGSCSLINNTIADILYDGVELRSSTECTVAHNTIRNCTWDGLAIISSSECNLYNNTFVDCGPVAYGVSVVLWTHSISNNTVNGRPLGYLSGISNAVVEGDSLGQIILVDCLNVTVKNGVFTNTSVGIQLAFSEDCVLLDNFVSDNAEGIHIIHSAGTTLSGNSVSESYGRGIWQNQSPFSEIVQNTFTNNTNQAIHLTYSNNCEIKKNIIPDGVVDLLVCNFITIEGNIISRIEGEESINCTIANNTVSNCSQTGVYMNFATNCTAYNNTVVDNGLNGIELRMCISCTIGSNRILNNSGSGVRVIGSVSCAIIQNNITGNGYIGTDIMGSEDVIIYGNRIGWNEGGNAWDGGSDNQWDDGVNAGNYWSDYDGYGEYEIPGSGGGSDRYPFALGEAPFLDHPQDIEYEVGTEGHTIVWNPSDSDPASYDLLMNSEIIESVAWDGGSITTDVDGLNVGVYNYTLVVKDEVGHWVADSVLVTVSSSEATTERTGVINPLTMVVISIGAFGAVVVVIMAVRKRT